MSLNLVALLRHCQPHGRNKPSQSRGQYEWILHIRDHFSKYSCAYPIKSKESMEGAIALMVSVVYPRFFDVGMVMSLRVRPFALWNLMELH